jgi:hypothetical protein
VSNIFGVPAFSEGPDLATVSRHSCFRTRTTATGQFATKEAEYFVELQKQSAEIMNPQIKAATQARQAEVNTKLSSLSQTGKTAGDLYDPFISDIFCRYPRE